MDYHKFEQQLVQSYRGAAERYRRDDEIEISTENHRRLCGNLRRISSSFPRRIRALDVGCGTGRHFHCLRNVRSLVGVDISPDMLQAAAEPVRSEEISIEEIQLIRSNIYEMSFPKGSFDFIYAMGVFGYGAPLNLEICRKFHEWLQPDGRVYFDTLDISNLGPVFRARRRLKQMLYPVLPSRLKRVLDERENRLPFFLLEHQALEELMLEAGFLDFVISTNVCRSPLWRGIHLECVASKGFAHSDAEPGTWSGH